MRKLFLTSLSALVLTACSGLTACGGGGSTNVDASPVIPTPPVSQNDIVCTEASNKNDLNNNPIYSFSGLQSNWANGDSVPGKVSSDNFSTAVSNYTAIAKDTNNSALKADLVSNIYRWSSADAFKGSRMCWSPNRGWDSTCTQWVDPTGNDLSAIQDNNFIMEIVESIRRSYSLISDWAKVNEPTKHQNIMSWLNHWDLNTPNPDNVFFGLGMGRYHWEIQRVADSNGLQATSSLVNRLMTGILPLINEDGSIVDRTTRGNRGLWYHYTSINEIMTSMHLSKEANITINPDLERRLHKAVGLFLNTLDNPSYIVTWASVGLNNGGDGTSQNFNYDRWYDNAYAGSWIYLYRNWYPTENNTQRLNAKVPANARSAFVDKQFGIPLGCVLY
jgi:hypothetical protein